MTTATKTVWHDLRVALEKFVVLQEKEHATHEELVTLREDIERLEKLLDKETI